MRAALLAVALAACGPAAPASAPPAAARSPAVSPAAATVELDAAPGLSGLAIDPDGRLWTVVERAGAAYAIRLDGEAVTSIEPFTVAGVPAGVDVEAIEALGDGRFLLGTEGKGDGGAALWTATLDPATRTIHATATPVTADAVGATIAPNHGIEGLCGDARIAVAAFETVLDDAGARWAQLAVVPLDAPATARVHRVRLTSPTGKLAALHCAPGDATIDVLAIERHFEVSRIVRFTLAPADAAATTAEVVVDLADVIAGRNLEGLAPLPDGRIALVVDNQWRTIEGPSALLLLRP